ncbi:SDR family NAD(P)-dependent oxidoreductase [Christensenella tenuis]|jgi:3-oxoacyl-[acyl-carrier protein] reductase|uniref:SDR family oxidoreductase n=1 Tax=Christensenella tenuis TaxID=2763033 RepID=A0ABR7EEL7_9FIRM|nr:SDR family NAD(P)-dependent oxidoreductase [Christensenella tenuis]MBC5648215.1 SDR family oxidoreductase [Christensenella tenuis]
MKDLVGKTAWVTGAAQGIGAAVTRIFAQHGAKVVGADLNLQAMQDTAGRMKAEGLDVEALRLDVADPQSVTEVAAEIEKRFGGVDILVNNAGINNNTPIPEMTVEQWDRLMNIDLRGAHLCSQAATIQMMKKKWGRIINIGSMAGQIGGLKVSPDYSAAKAGAICLAKSYARFGAQYGITANAVCPGFIETEMTRGRDDPSSVLIGRLGTPEDIAGAVYFLASGLGSYLTGATIDVNGGLLMR